MSRQEELFNKLIQNGVITPAQVSEINKEAKAKKKKFEEILFLRDLIKPEDFTKLKAEIYGMPYDNLEDLKVSEQVLNIISSQVAENYRIICFERDGSMIKVGITDPDNFKAMEAVDFLAKESNLRVEYFLISDRSFKIAFKKYKTIDKELDTALKEQEKEKQAETEDGKEKMESGDLEEITKSAPVAKIISVIIRNAVEGGASDIHIEPLHTETRVRYRIDGVLHTSLVLPINIHASLVARVKVLSNLKLDETRMPQDGRIRMKFQEKEIDFRISILPLAGYEKVVMRILDTTKGAPTLLELGYQGEQLRVIKSNMKKTEGILLVTGPTGSGKSTTLFSMIDELNKEDINISTLEDPVEYQIKGVNQSQIKPEIGFTFAAGLRTFLRQDPDIIMVGEVRDHETAELSIHAALTGHLVLSTLHTTNAPGAITRLVDMGIEPFLLGSTLKTILAQRLARKICQNCKEEIKLASEYTDKIKREIHNIGVEYIKDIIKDFNPDKLKFYGGKGCSRCGNTGYRGRMAVSEVMDINKAISEAVIKGKKVFTVKEILETQKYTTVYQDGIIKVLQGTTTYEEVLRVMQT